MSSRILQRVCTERVSSYKLDGVAKEKDWKNFTVKTHPVMLAEFYAALDVLNRRNASEYIHNYMLQTIAEAKSDGSVSKEEFERLVEEKQRKTQENSELRKKKSRNPASKPSDAKRPPHRKEEAA